MLTGGHGCDGGGQEAMARGGMVMTEDATLPRADAGARVEVVQAPEELDLATAGDLAARGCAMAVQAGVLLLDLSGVSFCDARGAGALVRIANQAGRAGCRVALIAPQPQVAKVLRICALDQRLPVFATSGDALAGLTAMPVPA
jgi:anti-sigma B factor antagonist